MRCMCTAEIHNFSCAGGGGEGMDSVRSTYTMMRGRHIEKRVPSKEFLSSLDKTEPAGSFF